MDPSTVAISALEHQFGSMSEPRILPRDIPTMEGRIRWLLKAIEDGVSVSISKGIEASPASEFLHTTKVALENEKRQPDIAALLLEFNELPADVFDLRGASLTIGARRLTWPGIAVTVLDKERCVSSTIEIMCRRETSAGTKLRSKVSMEYSMTKDSLALCLFISLTLSACGGDGRVGCKGTPPWPD